VVEVLEDLSYLGFRAHVCQRPGEAGGLLAQSQWCRQGARDVEVLASQIALDPPVGVVGVAEALQGLPCARKPVELATLLRLPDLLADPALVILLRQEPASSRLTSRPV